MLEKATIYVLVRLMMGGSFLCADMGSPVECVLIFMYSTSCDVSTYYSIYREVIKRALSINPQVTCASLRTGRQVIACIHSCHRRSTLQHTLTHSKSAIGQVNHLCRALGR